MGTGYAPSADAEGRRSRNRKAPGEVSGGFSCRSLFWGQSEQFPVFRLRQEAIEILQHGLLRVRVRIEFLHHAVTQQCRSPFIQFALFLTDLFLDRSEFLLERLPLVSLLLEQLFSSAASRASSLSVFGICSP